MTKNKNKKIKIRFSNWKIFNKKDKKYELVFGCFIYDKKKKISSTVNINSWALISLNKFESPGGSLWI